MLSSATFNRQLAQHRSRSRAALSLLSALTACSIAGGGGAGEVGAYIPPAAARGPTQSADAAATAAMPGLITPPRSAAAARPASIDQTGANNPAGITAAEVAQLVAGGPLADMRWLYPYDGTVFPGGTISPLVMWTGNSAPDVVYLHMKSRTFEYKGVLRPSTAGSLFVPGANWASSAIAAESTGLAQEANKQLAIPQSAWDAAGQQAQSRDDALSLELTERVDGQIHGPVRAQVTIARGALQGSIYYNTCWSGTVASSSTAVSGVGSMVMRIPSGENARPVSQTTQCIGCHSISADGSRVVAQRATGANDLSDAITTGAPVYAWSTQFTDDGTPDPNTSTHFGTIGSYGALYPDGSKYLAPYGNAGIPIYPASLVPLTAAVLYDATTGAVISDTGIPTGASMPMFSPDGTHLAFNDLVNGSGYALQLMDYDTRSDQAGASKTLVQDDIHGAQKPGWPFFLPDGHAVIFVQTTCSDFASGVSYALPLVQTTANDPNNKNATATPGCPSDVYIVDVATGTMTILAKAMGFDKPSDAATDTTYLPFAGQDLHRNYFPTVSPVASGGYFWVFFDSFRHFGSLATIRSVWAAAIDIHPDGSYTTDPSHPPFYVPGQEFISTSHHRAFATLDKCRPERAKCLTGIDCCDGRCSNDGICSAPPPGDQSCSKRDERCTTTADCCGLSDYCINDFCAFVDLL